MFLDQLYNSLAENKSKNAFCINDEFYSFGEFKDRIASVQQMLETNAEETINKRFAIFCKDDISIYAAIVGGWFLGYNYVPLGFDNPTERNLTILKESETKIILTTEPLDTDVYSGYKVINLKEINSSSVTLKKKTPVAEDLAYVLFTSGSTGLPKGVPISFGNLNAFLDAFEKAPVKIDSSDRCLQMFELTFDVSISSFLPALIKGACVYTVPNNVIKNVYVLKLISKYNLTVIQIVPSVIRLSMGLLSRVRFPSVKYCILTGEATHVELLEAFKPVIFESKIYNYYGPTECTIYCSYFDCNDSAVMSYNGMIAIGKPFDKMNFIVVDEHNQEVEAGVKGELLISGIQTTAGYLNNNVQSQVAFIRLDRAHTDYYRSGDACFYDQDKNFYYCGRLDNQVKVQGYRIELNEIEHIAHQATGINNVVIAAKGERDALQLIMVLESDGIFEKDKIIQKLKQKLPDYMIPAEIVSLTHFPLGSSGKINRKEIKELIGV